MPTEIKHVNIKNNDKLLSTKLTVKIVIYLYYILSFIFFLVPAIRGDVSNYFKCLPEIFHN